MDLTTRDLDPRQILQLVLRRKWVILIPVVTVSLAAYAGSYFIPPKYDSSVLVWIGNPVKLSSDLERMLGQFQDILGTMRNPRQDVEDLSRQISSVPYASLVYDKLKLDADSALDARARFLLPYSPDMNLHDVKIMLMSKRLTDEIELQFESNSLLRISAKTTDAYRARDLAQAVGEVFVEEKAREEMKALFLSMDFSHEFLAKYEKELQDKRAEKTQLEKEIAKWQGGNGLTSSSNRENLSAEIERRRSELSDLKSDEQALSNSLAEGTLQDLARAEPASLTDKKKQILTLIESVSELVQEYEWSDRAVSNMALRIVGLEDEVDAAHQRLVDQQYPNLPASGRAPLVKIINARHRIDLLTRYVSALQGGLTQIDTKLASVPDLHAKLDQVIKEMDAAQRMLDQFSTQQESFQISQELVEQSRYNLVENARVKPSPVWPDRRLIVMAGILVGLFLGGASLLIMELSDQTMKTIADVESTLGVPVLGVVPKIEASALGD